MELGQFGDLPVCTGSQSVHRRYNVPPNSYSLGRGLAEKRVDRHKPRKPRRKEDYGLGYEST